MDEAYQQQLISRVMTELLIVNNFKRYIVSKVNENLIVYSATAMPAMLYILTIGRRSDYKIDSVRVTPDFVENIIDGYSRDIVAFSYAHGIIVYGKDEEFNHLNIHDQERKIAIYYEDNLVRITNYHDLEFDILTDSMAIKYKPNRSVFNEFHPAMVNISNLLSIN